MSDKALRYPLNEAHTGQVEEWPLARKNYGALLGVETREVFLYMGSLFIAQHNPARAISASAKTDARSVAARPCFLCGANRPPEQYALQSARGYEMLVNPFPVFPQHFTIASERHEPQRFVPERAGEPWRRMEDLMAFARMMPGMALFYNGPRCGASAPDHFHFQAVPAAKLPLFDNWLRWGHAPVKLLRFRVSTHEAAAAEMERVCRSLGWEPGAEEPMMNIYAYMPDEGSPFLAPDEAPVEIIVIPRRAHRPKCYGTGEGEMLLSPAAIECAGVMIAPRREDFDRLDFCKINEILREVCYAEL